MSFWGDNMKNILVTGGTVFVSRYTAEYFAKKGHNIFVLNRNNHIQPEGVTLIKCDRHELGNKLKEYDFDVVLDINGYTKKDVEDLVTSLKSIKDYIFISSSAVYPETLPQPFKEEQKCGYNSIWKDYGMNKLEAEQYLLENVKQAYILRPPYLYGPMQNVYREPFIFECAMNNMPCYVLKDGKMKLQFFHVDDLCRFVDIILEKHPEEHIFNVGNEETVDINQWVKLCYEAVGKNINIIHVNEEHVQRDYFSFYDYEYKLDVTKQKELMPYTKPLIDGLKESYNWYKDNAEDVVRKPYLKYINENLV